MPGDFNGNGQVEQADLDLVLLHWGQDAASLPWTGPSATGLVDQDDLDAVLLNWGAADVAVSPAPTQMPLIEASASAMYETGKLTDVATADLFVVTKRAKTTHPIGSPNERLDEDFRPPAI